MNESGRIQRSFVEVPHGQMHYRYAGRGEPLLLLHASPGSSRQQLRLIGDFAGQMRVVAPDTPGNGDSDAFGPDETSIIELAAAMLAFMDAVGLDRVNLYGSHTGAAIASELAILAPARIGKIVLDGISNTRDEKLKWILANYAFPFEPDLDGAYLVRILQFCRDQYLFYPWFDRSRAARLDNGIGDAADLHALMVEVMKASQTYHRNYRAAFRWDAEARLPLVKSPVLLLAAENDPLYEDTEGLAPSLTDVRFARMPRLDAPDYATTRADAMSAFFAGA